MKRRDFIKKSISAGVVASAAVSVSGYKSVFSSQMQEPAAYDMVAIRGGEPGVMFNKAIEALGGIGKFVKKGQKVLVKPNIGWDAVPERAANTNPVLIGEIVKQCLNAGAKDVYVFDHTCNEWTYCYKNSGIEKAVKDAGGKIVPGNSESYYQTVKIENGTLLTEVKEHELVLESDVFINVPVLKHHEASKLSIAMKNLMGIVWSRGSWHSKDLHACIAEYAAFRKPDLNIVDAYNVMKRNGPRGVSTADVQKMQYQIITTDIVAADAASAKLFGQNPNDVRYITLADKQNAGTMNLDSLNIKRIAL